MMEGYVSDHERAEAVRKWLRENGLALVVGVAVGLGGLFGYRWWQAREQALAEAASARYEEALAGLRAGDLKRVEQAVRALRSEFAGSSYAALGALVLARAQLDAGEADAAEQTLAAVRDGAPDAVLRDLARLRIARLRLAAGDAEGAASALAGIGGFEAVAAELEGDIARARGRREAAVAAYRRALEAGTTNAGLVRMKLEALGAAQG